MTCDAVTEAVCSVGRLTEIMVGKDPVSRKDKWHLLKVVVKDRFADKVGRGIGTPE
jgi:hypothetical protein